jgi:hypothetical protein
MLLAVFLTLNIMKLKNDFNLEKLLDYGFSKIDKQEMMDDDNWTLSVYDYLFEIGHARRGQFYYLLVSEETRTITLYASEPDGSGGTIYAPDVLIKMSLDGVFAT